MGDFDADLRLGAVQCDAGAVGFDDRSADLFVDAHRIAGGNERWAVALVAVGVARGRVAAAQMLGLALLLAEEPANGRAVAVQISFLLGVSVVEPQLQHLGGQADDGLEVAALWRGVVAVGLGDAQLVPWPGYGRGVGELYRQTGGTEGLDDCWQGGVDVSGGGQV